MSVHFQSWDSGFSKMADHLRTMMEEMQSGSFFKSHHPHTWKPALNLYETRDAFVVCVELAGMARERIDVAVEENWLIIRGVREKPVIADAPGDVLVHLMEIDSGPFTRKVELPADVNRSGIEAAYRHGYLWVKLPRLDRGDHARS